jgi:2-polyprenyl-3-methyl-5-hydroxy-6-metoxy-1,4-benzoquinol methylase
VSGEPHAPELAEGAYARKQLFGALGILRWSHGSRFRVARRLLEPHAGRPLLDYGCGDGTFLATVRDLFPHAVGAEVDPALAAANAARFAGEAGLTFAHTSAVEAPPGGFGAVVCMEVLEHCPPDAVDRVLAEIRRLAAPDAVVVVSVPVETGPPLAAKQLVRAIAARRGMEGYRLRETYRPGEFLRMLLAGPGTAIDRPLYEGEFAPGVPNLWHGHKGFNWRALRRRISRDFEVRATRFSPLGVPGGLLASQAWLVCAPR